MTDNEAFNVWWEWFTKSGESGYDEESEHEDIAADAFEAGQAVGPYS